MEDTDQQETQYVSDEEGKAFDWELGEVIDIWPSEETLEAKRATGDETANGKV